MTNIKEKYKNNICVLTEIIFLLGCCIIGLWFISLNASAIDIAATNTSYIIVSEINETPNLQETIPYIYQGDTVYVGDVIDISGAAPPYASLAYWNGYDMYDSEPTYVMELPDSSQGYYKFNLSFEIFGNRLGRWYKWDGDFEKRGNNHIFTVNPKLWHNSTLTFSNGTAIVTSEEIPQNYTRHKVQPAPLMPEKFVSDYLVAKGDEVAFPEGDYRIWVFGRTDGIYAREEHNITKDQIFNMGVGNYDVVFQYHGNNTIYDASCGPNNCDVLIPGLYGKKPVNIYGYQPLVVYDKLKEMLAGTDDKLVEYDLRIEDPYITINQADETEYTTHSALNVRGYSNVANGTKITVSLDEKSAYYKDLKKMQIETSAVRISVGNLSYYSVDIPFNYEDIAADARNHTLTARTELGGIVQKDFKVSLMPADSYRPNASLKYIEDRNPFVPTPTPEIRTVVVTQTIEVVKQITIPVTPTNEQVREEQDKIITDKIVLILFVVVGSCIIAAIAWYAYSVYKRGRKHE